MNKQTMIYEGPDPGCERCIKRRQELEEEDNSAWLAFKLGFAVGIIVTVISVFIIWSFI